MGNGCTKGLSSAKRYKITFFKKLIGVTACKIVGTLYWWYTQKIIFAVFFPQNPSDIPVVLQGTIRIKRKSKYKSKNQRSKKSVSKTPCASVLSVSFFWPSFCSRRLTGRITASQLEWRNNVLRPWWQVWGQIFCPHTNPHTVYNWISAS